MFDQEFYEEINGLFNEIRGLERETSLTFDRLGEREIQSGENKMALFSRLFPLFLSMG